MMGFFFFLTSNSEKYFECLRTMAVLSVVLKIQANTSCLAISWSLKAITQVEFLTLIFLFNLTHDNSRNLLQS